MSPRRGHLRRAAANAALLLGSTLLALGLLEAGVRIIRPQPLSAIHRSARLGWMHSPNSSLVYERAEFKIAAHFSSAGLRDREYPIQKPAGTRRIAVLGDSFVEALQVPLDSMLTRRVEACLGEDPGAPRVEVLNFGVSGYGSCQELLALEEAALRFQPDVVVVVWYHNDLDDDRHFGGCDLDAAGALRVRQVPELTERERLVSNAKSFFYQHSHLFMFVYTRHPRTLHPRVAVTEEHGSQGPSPSAVVTCPGEHATLGWRTTLKDEPEDVKQAVQLNVEIWKRMAADCGQHGAGFLAVLGVSASEVEPERAASDLKSHGCLQQAHDVTLPSQRLLAAAEASGVPVLDLLPAFREGAAREKLYFRTEGHWNAVGHRVAARALCGALRGMLSSASYRPQGGP